MNNVVKTISIALLFATSLAVVAEPVDVAKVQEPLQAEVVLNGKSTIGKIGNWSRKAGWVALRMIPEAFAGGFVSFAFAHRLAHVQGLEFKPHECVNLSIVTAASYAAMFELIRLISDDGGIPSDILGPMVLGFPVVYIFYGPIHDWLMKSFPNEKLA